MDRKKLGLKPLYKNEESDTEGETEDETEGEIDGVNLVKLNKWLNDNSLVGKMVRYLYDCEGSITFEQFKNGINYEKSDEEFLSNIKNGKGVKCRFGKLWHHKNDNIKLNQNIKEYIDKM
jgi:hypothetical protein